MMDILNKTIKAIAFGVVAVAVAFSLGTNEALAQVNDDCMACHSDETMTGEGGRKIFVDLKKFDESVHGKNSVQCIMCHADLAGVVDWPHEAKLKTVVCSNCHDAEEAKYKLNIHGKTRASGNKDAPACGDCHGSHYILPKSDPMAMTNPINVPKICDRCHADAELAKRNGLPDPSFIKSYDTGIHGKGLRESGLISAANCISCHSAHDISKKEEPDSKVNRKEIPKTCGACHVGIFQQYITSVHGLDYLKGIKDVPVCTDCHGEHNILDHKDPKSTVFTTHVGTMCGRCHDDAELNRKFNLPVERLRSYEGTYHGVAGIGGDEKVANCASCHGVHNILPSANPLSMINPKNLPSTCGKPECHGSRLENVVKGKVHIIEQKQDNIWLYIVSNLYKVLISMVIGGFVVFIFVDLYARIRRKSTGAGGAGH